MQINEKSLYREKGVTYTQAKPRMREIIQRHTHTVHTDKIYNNNNNQVRYI